MTCESTKSADKWRPYPGRAMHRARRCARLRHSQGTDGLSGSDPSRSRERCMVSLMSPIGLERLYYSVYNDRSA